MTSLDEDDSPHPGVACPCVECRHLYHHVPGQLTFPSPDDITRWSPSSAPHFLEPPR